MVLDGLETGTIVTGTLGAATPDGEASGTDGYPVEPAVPLEGTPYGAVGYGAVGTGIPDAEASGIDGYPVLSLPDAEVSGTEGYPVLSLPARVLVSVSVTVRTVEAVTVYVCVPTVNVVAYGQVVT